MTVVTLNIVRAERKSMLPRKYDLGVKVAGGEAEASRKARGVVGAGRN